jgi:extradiol dioxygenase family protein
MSVTGLNHYNLRAPRQLLDELRHFYVAVVGLMSGPRPPLKTFGYWLYAGNQDVLHLTQAAADEKRSKNVVSTMDHVAFTCTDFLAAKERLQKHNVAYTIDEVPLTGEQQLFFSDPAGNGVELSCPRNIATRN